MQSGQIYDLTNKIFIVVQIVPDKAFGRLYYVDADGDIIWMTRISSGRAGRHDTRSGIYKIYYKKKKHMSTKYPDPSGINNMDNSMFFNGGIALHKGNPKASSHGCIHVPNKMSSILFRNTPNGTTVVVTRSKYNLFMNNFELDLLNINP